MEIIIIALAIVVIFLLLSIDRSMQKQNVYTKEMIKRLDILLKKDRD